MSMHTTIHDVVTISHRRVNHGDFVSHEFMFQLRGGDYLSISAIAKSPLSIEFSPDRLAHQSAQGVAVVEGVA